MVVIVFQSDDRALLEQLEELWNKLDCDEAALDEFCHLLNNQVSQAIFGPPTTTH